MDPLLFGYPPVECGNNGRDTCRFWKDDSNGCADWGCGVGRSNGLYDADWGWLGALLGGWLWVWLAPARSKGLVEVFNLGGGAGRADAVGAVFEIEAGILSPDAGLLPSPSLSRVSTARSKSSLSPRRTVSFRLSLLNPISRREAIFDSNDAVVTSATGAPSPCVGLWANAGGW
jgi:hypothetical protein